MFIELLLAAIAMIVWVRTGPGVVNTLAHNTVFAASTITLLFNANPLMRFDGYYILSDLIRIPNLGTKGQQFTQWLMRKTFYAVKDLPLPSTFKEHPWGDRNLRHFVLHLALGHLDRNYGDGQFTL